MDTNQRPTPTVTNQGNPGAAINKPAAPAPPAAPSAPAPSKIQHSRTAFAPPTNIPLDASKPVDPNRPLPVTPGGAAAKITAFGRDRRHEDSWTRTPNTNGTGAIHVKTFHCKLNEDALSYMDQTINEWLDAHPQYEVKFVSSTIGTMTGKLKEPALFCQVWV